MSCAPAPSPATDAAVPSPIFSGGVIRVRGARVHNLKNIDVDLPRDRFVVITGPSGSGKSSLAFDTLFAEGQRQFIETLSTYARQFLHQLERPDVDIIEGLQPTICIDQRGGSANPRSTVATVTEIYDYLRLLMSRLGVAHCYNCGTPIRQQSAEEIQVELLRLPPGTKAMLLAPMVRGRKGAHREVFEAIRKAGFQRARVDGEVLDVGGEPPALAPRKNHTIEAVVDRIVIREGIADRLAESIQLAITHGEGALQVSSFVRDTDQPDAGVWRDTVYSTLYACPNCKISYEELEPRTFSFNSPYGACPTCEGLGSREQFDPDLILGDEELSLATGLVLPWKNAKPDADNRHRESLRNFLADHDLRWNTPYSQWKPAARKIFIHGEATVDSLLPAQAADKLKYLGLLTLLEQEFVTATDAAEHQRLATFRGQVTCAACGGARLRPEARSVRLGEKAIHEICSLSVTKARAFFDTLPPHIADEDLPIYEPLAAEIVGRLNFLSQVGVPYLALDRPADTLSGGELQRVRLATGIGSGLVGTCYVLDEPSIGLHPRDNQRLIDALRNLQAQGNTLIVVEHDDAMMRQADWLIDMGPAAGVHGGQIVSQGTPADVCGDANSITGRYLAGDLKIFVPTARRRVAKTRSIALEGVTTNNLKNIDVRFPLGVLACVTGVSGSGKSSLINGTLARALVRRLTGEGPKAGPHTSLRGVQQIDKVVVVDQSPIGRSPRSNPATYVGIFDEIRKVFAATREAKERGYKSGRFSFNIKGGRCEECQGQGQKRLEMQFLPDLYVMCPTCIGRRFNRQTLEVKFKGHSIADVLELSIDDAAELLTNVPTIARLLASLQEVGLGYLTLGQSATTLSGGEAQRIKLAAELSRVSTGGTFYILDEPTTGLHFDDVRKLLEVLHRLVDLGNTVLVIEHNLDVLKSADWLLDLGPEGGEAGGYLVAEGTPEELAVLPDNATGKFLRAVLNT